MSTIEMTPVASSNIKAVAQDGHKLRVQFHSGQAWEYDNAAHHYDAMVKPGASPGKYFHANVKGRHEGRKVE